jgi:hypothetical protein
VDPDGRALQRLDLAADLIKDDLLLRYLRKQNAALADRYLRDIVGALSVVMRMTLLESLRGGRLGDSARPLISVSYCVTPWDDTVSRGNRRIA